MFSDFFANSSRDGYRLVRFRGRKVLPVSVPGEMIAGEEEAVLEKKDAMPPSCLGRLASYDKL